VVVVIPMAAKGYIPITLRQGAGVIETADVCG